MSTKDWHPYTKYIIALVVLGTAAFLFLGAGSGTDYWVTTTHANMTGEYLESNRGLWRECYHPETVPNPENSRTSRCKNVDFRAMPNKFSPGYDYKITMYALELSSLILIISGLLLVFFGDLLSLCTLGMRRKSWFVAAGTFHLLGGICALVGVCVFITMVTHQHKWWPISELGEPPDIVMKFSWSFALIWIGLTFAIVVGGTYIWLSRLYVEDML
ncbi:claudin domain-containing protein 1-like [Glandiceps talaboti]